MRGVGMDTVQMAFMFRGITMLMVCGGAIMSIYLGWKLYRDGINSPVVSELSKGESLRFTLKALGPGIFFAIFGMWILVQIVQSQTVFEPAIEPDKAEQVGIAPTHAKQSFAFATNAYAQGAPRKRTTRICFPYGRLVSYSGENLRQADFETALRDAVDLLRTGNFPAQDSVKVNSAISILSKLNERENGLR